MTFLDTRQIKAHKKISLNVSRPVILRSLNRRQEPAALSNQRSTVFQAICYILPLNETGLARGKPFWYSSRQLAQEATYKPPRRSWK